MWNLVWLHGAGSAEQRSRVVAWQMAGVRKGMVDFYLRWWNGAHCVFAGFGKQFESCGAKLEGGVHPRDLMAGAGGGGSNSTAAAATSTAAADSAAHPTAPSPDALAAIALGLPVVGLERCEGLRLALMPEQLYAMGPMFGPPSRRSLPPSLIARSPKPVQRDRLRLNRYDMQDFDEIVAAMKADGLWLLD